MPSRSIFTPGSKGGRTRGSKSATRWVLKSKQPVFRPLQLRARRLVYPPKTGDKNLVIHRRGPLRMLVGFEDPQEKRAMSEARVAGTLPERIFYKSLVDRGMREGVDFSFQSSLQGGRLFLGGMVADFILQTRALVVRIQGRKWHTGFAPERRDDFQRDVLENMGYHVLDVFDDTIYDQWLFDEWLRRHIDVHPSTGGFFYDPEMGADGDLTMSVAQELRDMIQGLQTQQLEDKARIEELEGLISPTRVHPHLQITDANITNVSASSITAGGIKANEYIESTGFEKGSTGFRITGEGAAEFGSANIRGTLNSVNMKQETVSNLGGTVVFLPNQGKLISAVSTTDSSIDIEENSLEVGSNIRFQDVGRVEWMRIRGTATAITNADGESGFRFPVDRAIAGTATAWQKGETCGGFGRAYQDGQRSNVWGENRQGATATWGNVGAGWGSFGVDHYVADGWARIESTDTDSPYYTIEERSSITPDTGTTQFGRYGKVDGFLSYSAGGAETGFAVGDSSSSLTWDTTNGLKMEISGGKVEIDEAGITMTEDSVGAGDWISFRDSGGRLESAIYKNIGDEQLYIVHFGSVGSSEGTTTDNDTDRDHGVIINNRLWDYSAETPSWVYKNHLKLQSVSGSTTTWEGASIIKMFDTGDTGSFGDSDLSGAVWAAADSGGDWAAGDMHVGAKDHVWFATSIEGTPAVTGGFSDDKAMMLVDGVSAPATLSGYAKLYVDSSDGDLKVKFGDGTVKTITVDT